MKKKLFIIFLFLLPVSASVYSQFDIRLLRLIYSHDDGPRDDVFKFISNTTTAVVVGVPAGMATIGLITHDDQTVRNARVAITASALNFGVTEGLKYTFKRDRPFIPYLDIQPRAPGKSYSFPSGHSSSAFATATSMSLDYPKWYVIVPAYTWATSVAYSRLDLGVHYPSDVLAGAVVGSGCAWLTHVVNKKLQANSDKKHKTGHKL
jgi:membrane-associated phospholipid phosphatase